MAITDGNVSSTDGAGFDLEQDLPLFRGLHRDLLDNESCFGLLEHGGFAGAGDRRHVVRLHVSMKEL